MLCIDLGDYVNKTLKDNRTPVTAESYRRRTTSPWKGLAVTLNATMFHAGLAK